jgi:hypothetical protein
VRYLRKAGSDLHATVELPVSAFETPGDLVMPVKIGDVNGEIVVEADITMYISPRPAKN